MEMRTLGPGGPEVSAIGFGGMPLSIELQGFPRPSEADAIRVLHAVLERGVTLLDTADVYSFDDRECGHNERLMRKALASWGGARERVVVATKGGLRHPEQLEWVADGRPEHLRAACDRSLEALGVERIDLYQLHAPDPAVPFEDSVGAIKELRDAGKVRWVGLSNVGVPKIARAQKIVPIHTVQNMLSPLARDSLRRGLLRKSVVDYCSRHGIGFLAYSPLGGAARGAVLAKHPALGRIARARGVSPQRVALAWCLAQGPTVIPIPAARSEAHAVDSIAASELTLTREELAAIDAARF
jgi:aryl-alcohol dehydrogenase-like predicted oxidoreductase